MPEPLTSIEEWALTTKCKNTQQQLMLLLLLKCGMTLHELAEIKVKHIDLKTSTLTIPAEHTKNKTSRRVRLSEELAILCQDYITKEQRTTSSSLFFTRQSRKMTERRIQQIIRTSGLQILNKEISPQTLRSTYITNALNNHTPLNDIEKALGMNSIQHYLYQYYARKKQ
jgi:integrase